MTVPFPAFIIVMAVLQLWIARYARDRNWTS